MSLKPSVSWKQKLSWKQALLVGSTLFGLTCFGLAQAKPITKYTATQNGKMPEPVQAQLASDVLVAKNNIPTEERYAEIVADPFKASSESEKIAAMSAREIFILVDRSGSMGAGDENPTGGAQKSLSGGAWTRWDSAYVALESLYEVATSLDRDAKIDVTLWDRSGSGPRYVDFQIENVGQIKPIFNSNTPQGSTPLADALNHSYDKDLKRRLANNEPITVIILTDGAPDNAAGVEEFFTRMVREQRLTESGRETLAAFSFVRMGDDTGAMQFLKHLDDDLKPRLGVDIIDTKADNFLFATGEYLGSREAGPFALMWGAIYD